VHTRCLRVPAELGVSELIDEPVGLAAQHSLARDACELASVSCRRRACLRNVLVPQRPIADDLGKDSRSWRDPRSALEGVVGAAQTDVGAAIRRGFYSRRDGSRRPVQ